MTADKIKALYDKAPFPEVFGGHLPQSNVLLTHWINAASQSFKVLAPGTKILLAGCGSGEEGIMLAGLFPEAKVLGVDFSEQSIKLAKERLAHTAFQNLNFEIADLMDSEYFLKYSKFDFILCHGVGDYVNSPVQLFKTFENCLSENGIIAMTVNSPNHPASRIRAAFAALGLTPDDFADSLEQRSLLRLADHLMGNDSGLVGIGNASKSYLDVDVFAPIAHHASLQQWENWAKRSNLNFLASLDAVTGLMMVDDTELPLLYSLDKAQLSKWFYGLCRRPGIQMLFGRNKRIEPNFDCWQKILEWTPKLDEAVGELPVQDGNLNQQKKLTLRFQGFPDFVINTRAYDLEVLRRCRGQKKLKDIIAEIASEADLEPLRASLFRAYHYGFLV